MSLTVLDACFHLLLEDVQRLAANAPDVTGPDLVDDPTEEPARRLVVEPQRDLRPARCDLAQAPPSPLVDAGDAVPGHVGGRVELGHLDETADLGGADLHAHV